MSIIDLISLEYHFVIWQRLYILVSLIIVVFVLVLSKNLKIKTSLVNGTFWFALFGLGIAYTMLFERRGIVEPLVALFLVLTSVTLSKKIDSFVGVFRNPFKNWIFWVYLIGFLVVTNQVLFIE